MNKLELTKEQLIANNNFLQEKISGLEKELLAKTQASDSLKIADMNLLAILENNADGILIVDMEGIVLYVNPAAEHLFGRSRENFIGYNFGFPVSVKLQKDALVIINGDTHREAEFRIVHVEWNKRQAFQLSIRDVTDEKQTERELRLSESRYKTLTEFAPVGIFRTNANGVTDYVNPHWCKISGMSSDEALGRGWLQAVHPDDREPIEEGLRRAALTLTTSSEEYRFLHNDGSVTWVSGHAVPIKDHNGNVVGYYGTITDITDRKHAESELIESEGKFRSIMENSADAIFITDQNGKYLYTNKEVTQMLGFTPDEMKGKSIIDISPEGRISEYLEIFSMLSTDGKVFAEFELVRKDGSLISTDLNSTILPGGLVYGSCRDITDRKKISEDLILAKNKAEESDKLKTAFLHNISHEIRTPLNAIIGFSALLGEPDMQPNDQKSFIDIINQSSNHLLAIISDIIEISNIEAGILKLNQKTINLNGLLNDLYNQFYQGAIKKNILFSVETHLSDADSDIKTDRTKLTQILINLLSNAFKFTHNGQIKFGYKLNNDQLEFFVADTGIGISAEEYTRVFDRFYQVEYSDFRTFDGTGLGLSISKSYVEFLGGSIWLESEPGKGTTFYFTIPYLRDNNRIEAVNALEKTKVNPNRKKRILIAEDEDNNYMLLFEFLSVLGHSIIRAHNGKEAVDFCVANHDTDLVLMDIKMPLMDGYSATKEIRKTLPFIPVIATTAYAYESDKERAISSGCNDYISKPVNRNILLEMVKKYI